MTSGSEDRALGRLILLCLEGTADPDQVAQLEGRLKEDAEARRYYMEFLVIYAGLRRSASALIPGENLLQAASTALTEEEKIHEIERYARRQLEAFLDQEHQQTAHGPYPRPQQRSCPH